ncbi:cation:proton antiporter [Erysipelothrix urinaevulpis]|uniref:cation:proton antiporter n=1 Tax=Erysipelothrix urinaevulpis TaxID=2683717 RepID=UPI00135805BB|nr:cation:proton antiporter [Erysipelothrix urinaevulpis]
MLIIRLFFSICLAFIAGKIVSRLGLPEILGWLITGMVIGPFGLNILSDNLITSNWYHVLLAVFETIVGLIIGSELVIDKLKKTGSKVVITTLFQSLFTFVFVTFIFYIALFILKQPTYIAPLFGAIALATAPAPALSIVKEFKTKGPLTDTLIPMAALDDIVAIVIFLTTNSLIASDASQGIGSIVLNVIAMIAVPLIIGLVSGLCVGYLMNKTSYSNEILVLFGIILIAGFSIIINSYVFKQDLINFMLLGMAFSSGFSNLIPQQKQEIIMHNLNPVIGLGLLLVIMNLGAPLNYELIFGAGLFTLIYILSRALGKYIGAYAGAKYTKLPHTVQKYLGLTLLPHSGVSLVFTGIAASTLMIKDPNAALLIQGTIAAAAVINEIIAVVLSKKAFEWANEFNQAT